MDSTISKRFVKCHDYLRATNIVKSSRQFALSLGYLPQSWSEVQKGRRDVNLELLKKGVEVFGINPYYVLLGEEPMFSKDKATPKTTKHDLSQGAISLVTQNQKIMYVKKDNPETLLSQLSYFYLPGVLQHGNHLMRAFEVSSDYMEPTLIAGDIVVGMNLEQNDWKNGIRDNSIYIVVTKYDIIIRRLINDIANKERVIMQSDNLYYEPFPVLLKDIREVWLVTHKITSYLPSPFNFQSLILEEMQELKHQIKAIKTKS